MTATSGNGSSVVLGNGDGDVRTPRAVRLRLGAPTHVKATRSRISTATDCGPGSADRYGRRHRAHEHRWTGRPPPPSANHGRRDGDRGQHRHDERPPSPSPCPAASQPVTVAVRHRRRHRHGRQRLPGRLGHADLRPRRDDGRRSPSPVNGDRLAEPNETSSST